MAKWTSESLAWFWDAMGESWPGWAKINGPEPSMVWRKALEQVSEDDAADTIHALRGTLDRPPTIGEFLRAAGAVSAPASDPVRVAASPLATPMPGQTQTAAYYRDLVLRITTNGQVDASEIAALPGLQFADGAVVYPIERWVKKMPRSPHPREEKPGSEEGAGADTSQSIPAYRSEDRKHAQ